MKLTIVVEGVTPRPFEITTECLPKDLSHTMYEVARTIEIRAGLPDSRFTTDEPHATDIARLDRP